MKKILIILFILISYPAFSQVKHYVKNGGNDGNTGLSDAQAWATIAKVNTHTFIPGDTIAFKCGDVWRLVNDPGGTFQINEVGTNGHNIVFTSYGAGDKPRFLGSDTITHWNNAGSNIWWGYKASLNPLGNGRVFFELVDTVCWGILETTKSNINAPYEYLYSNDTVYVYSTSDPASAFVSVEITQVNNLFALQTGTDSSEYVTFDGLEIAYSSDGILRSEYPGGTNSGKELKGVEVRNCHLHHCGYKNLGGIRVVQLLFSDMIIENNEINDGGRNNIAITPDGSFPCNYIRNIVIRHNYIHDGFHDTGTGLVNLKTGITISNIEYIGNLFEDNLNDTYYSIMFYIDDQSSGGATIKNIKFINNIFLNMKGSGIESVDADSVYILHNTFYGISTHCPNFNAMVYGPWVANKYFVMKDNIFYVCTNTSYVYAWDSPVFPLTNAEINYNLYYRVAGGFQDIIGYSVGYDATEWAAYKAATGFDANSPTPANPLFINVTFPVEDDSLMIDALSPAKNSGIGVGVNTDYRDSLRDATVDIGAYEQGATGGDPPAPPDLPTVTETYITALAINEATGGGNVTDDGGGTVSTRGVCWKTTVNPVITDSHTHDGTGTGIFYSALTGLTQNTTYHVRAYATNEVGTFYGPDLEFTTLVSTTVQSLDSLSVGGTTYIDSVFIRNDSLIFRLTPSGKEYGIARYYEPGGDTIVGQYFVDAINGNDGNTGTHPDSAWRTLSKVNGYTFTAGDTISFAKGGTWREKLVVPHDSLVFMNYGLGPKPKILGSKQSSGFADCGGNVWKSSTVTSNPRSGYQAGAVSAEIHFVGNDHSVKWGSFKADTASLTAEYNWTWLANYVYVYAATDPDDRYDTIEVPQRQECVDLNNKQYIEINGLELAYAAYEGITYDWNLAMVDRKGLHIENCKIGYIGGDLAGTGAGFGIDAMYDSTIIRNNEIFETGRRGLGFHLYGSGFTVDNILIEQNYFHDGYHTTGVDISVGSGSYTGNVDSVVIRRNLFDDPPTATETCHQMFVQNYDTAGGGATVNSVYVYSNIFKTAKTDAIMLEGAESVYIYNNTFYNHNTVKTSNTSHIWVDKACDLVEIKNNIFYTTLPSSTGYIGMELYEGAGQAYANIDADYNLYYRTADGLRVIVVSGTSYYRTVASFDAMRTATGWEANSPYPADPLFNSVTDYHLQNGSPAINAGLTIPCVDVDYAGTARTGVYEIGAYQK